MKIHRYLKTALLALCSSVLIASSGEAQTTDLVFNTFDTPSETNNWTKFWGGDFGGFTWDGTKDAQNKTNSGSLRMNIAWGTSAGDPQFSLAGTTKQGSTWFGAAPIDATLYTNLQFDILWDTNGPSAGGNYGNLEIGMGAANYANWDIGSYSPVGDGLWHHVTITYDPSKLPDGMTNVGAVFFKVWSPTLDATGIPGGFWLDNVVLVAKTGPPPPPPTVSAPTAPIKGLNLIATDSTGQYGRESVATLNNYPFPIAVSGSPVTTYSMTITNYPAPSPNGWQTHIFLVPSPGTESSPDWNEADLIMLDIESSANGGANATFRYKTNYPSGNHPVYDPNNPTNTWTAIPFPRPSIFCSNPLGTWSLTFSNDTNVTITTPCGTSTNFVWDPNAVANFASGALTVYFGAQPGSTTMGQRTVLSSVSITNTTGVLLQDNFTGETLDTVNNWAIRAADANGVVQIPPDAAYLVSWSIPDAGFDLYTATNLLGGSNAWSALTGPNAITNANAGPLPTTSTKMFGKRVWPVPFGFLEATNIGYFRLLKDQ